MGGLARLHTFGRYRPVSDSPHRAGTENVQLIWRSTDVSRTVAEIQASRKLLIQRTGVLLIEERKSVVPGTTGQFLERAESA